MVLKAIDLADLICLQEFVPSNCGCRSRGSIRQRSSASQQGTSKSPWLDDLREPCSPFKASVEWHTSYPCILSPETDVNVLHLKSRTHTHTHAEHSTAQCSQARGWFTVQLPSLPLCWNTALNLWILLHYNTTSLSLSCSFLLSLALSVSAPCSPSLSNRGAAAKRYSLLPVAVHCIHRMLSNKYFIIPSAALGIVPIDQFLLRASSKNDFTLHYIMWGYSTYHFSPASPLRVTSVALC